MAFFLNYVVNKKIFLWYNTLRNGVFMEQFKKIYTFENCSNELFALGPDNKNINLLSELLNINIVARHQDIFVLEDVDEVKLVQILDVLEKLSCKQIYLSAKDIKLISNSIKDELTEDLLSFLKKEKCL